MIDVTVKIPEDRVGEFYELVGRWLAGQHSPRGADMPEGTDSTMAEWTNSDDNVQLARMVWDKCSARARAMFSLLMDRPGHRVSGDELAAMLEIPNGKYGIAGVLAWPGRHCTAVGRRPLWKWEDGPPGGSASYWIDKDVADLFSNVR